MKKSHIAVLTGILIIFVFFFILESVPENFLAGVEEAAIGSIDVRDGSTGESFTIENRPDIEAIAEDIKGQSFTRSGISIGRMGTWLTLEFKDEEGRVLEKFIINGEETIRKDPFFYEAAEDLKDAIEVILRNSDK